VGPGLLCLNRFELCLWESVGSLSQSVGQRRTLTALIIHTNTNNSVNATVFPPSLLVWKDRGDPN